MTQTDEEWWESLTDEAKFNAYKGMRSANKSHADALHAIVDHLLGEDWYCMSMDIYGGNEEIVAAIKHHYPDVNYNWSRTYKKIKRALRDYINR